MTFVLTSLTHPSVQDEQHGSLHLASAIDAPHSDSPIPSSIYEEDEDESIPIHDVISSSPLSPPLFEPYLLADEHSSNLPPATLSELPALESVPAMPHHSPLLAASVYVDSYLAQSHPHHPPTHHSSVPHPAVVLRPAASSSAAVPNLGGIHVPSPSPPAYLSDPVAFPPAPLSRASTAVEVCSDDSSDDGIEVLHDISTVRAKRKPQRAAERREERRRQRLEQQTAQSPPPPPEHIIDAEAEATADIVDLTSDNHPLLAPSLPQHLPPPVDVVAEPPSPPAPRHTCPICLMSAEELASLKCGHVFCHTCLETAVQLTHKCPTCRAKAGKRDIRRLYM